jgi:type II secretory pathway component PulF
MTKSPFLRSFVIRHSSFVIFPMPEFAYIARDLTGKRVEGTLAAGTEREAVASLTSRDLFPLKVATSDRRVGVAGSPRVKARVMAATYSQLSALQG